MATRLLTDAELRGIYGDAVIHRLAVRDGSGVEGDGVVEGAILRAEDEALSTLRQRFSDTEIPAVPGDASEYLKELVAGLAYYRLHKHFDSNPGKAIAERDDARAGLASIRRGEMSALLEGSPDVDSGRAAVVAIKRRADLYEQPITIAAMDRMGHR